MPPRPPGHAALGSGSAILGAGLLVAGVARPAALSGALLETPAWALAIVCGAVLSLAGGLTLLFTRQQDDPEPDVPAHVAFTSRMTIPDAAAAIAAPAPRAAGTAAQVAPMGRLPQPVQPTQGRVPAPKGDMVRIDQEIRDLTKKINKAGVMLATGQLSQQGYLAYVEDLKRQRGKLEAQRVRVELS